MWRFPPCLTVSGINRPRYSLVEMEGRKKTKEDLNTQGIDQERNTPPFDSRKKERNKGSTKTGVFSSNYRK